MPIGAEHNGKVLVDRAIAFARHLSQTVAVEHHDGTTAVGDQDLLLQQPRDRINRSPLHPEQARERFLGERQAVAANPVGGMEQPTGGAYLDRVKGVARDRLHDLREGNLRRLHADCRYHHG